MAHRLEHIENIRDDGKDWTVAVYGVARLFPAEEEKKIKEFIKRKQGENTKKLLDYIEKAQLELDKTPSTLAETTKNDELMSKMQIIAKLRAFVTAVDQLIAQLNIKATADLLDFEWEMLEKVEE